MSIARSNRTSRKSVEQVKPESSLHIAQSVAESLPLRPSNDSPPPPLVPKKWQRPKKGIAYNKVAQVLVHRASGKKLAEIAEIMGTTEGYIKQLMWLAGKNGWFTERDIADPSEELVYSTAHKVLRNINASLDGEELKAQQFEMTHRAADGIGMFKQHSTQKSEGQQAQVAVAIKIVSVPLPEGAKPAAMLEGSIGGTPGYIEGEISGGD